MKDLDKDEVYSFKDCIIFMSIVLGVGLVQMK